MRNRRKFYNRTHAQYHRHFKSKEWKSKRSREKIITGNSLSSKKKIHIFTVSPIIIVSLICNKSNRWYTMQGTQYFHTLNITRATKCIIITTVRNEEMTLLTLPLVLKMKIKKCHSQMSNMSMQIVLLCTILDFPSLDHVSADTFIVWHTMYNIILWLWFAVIVICFFFCFTFCDFRYAFGMYNFRERSHLQKWRKALHIYIYRQGNAHTHTHNVA